jgi:hypothetical protein
MISPSFVIRLDSVADVPVNCLESLTHFRDVVGTQRVLDDKVGNRIDIPPNDTTS